MARIPKIAAAFRGVDREELQAELAVTLLHLRRKRTIGIRNWKSYLAKSLLNRASKFAKHWRRQGAMEVGYDPALLPEDFAHHIDDLTRPEPTAVTEMRLIRRRLSRRSFEFLRLLGECHGSISALARKLGQHRNTVGRRLKKIRDYLRSAQNVSSSAKEQFREPPKRMLARRVLIVQALADGQTYRAIEQAVGVSHPTIARWRRRFEEMGVAGLNSLAKAHRLSERRIHFEAWLRTAGPKTKRVPLSALAKRFGIGKTTVHRILREHRRG